MKQRIITIHPAQTYKNIQSVLGEERKSQEK